MKCYITLINHTWAKKRSNTSTYGRHKSYMSVYIYHKLHEQLYFAYTWLRAFFMSELQLLKVEFPAPEGPPLPTNGIKS